MKLPNSYGSVTKLTGNRRRPYIVRISGKSVYDEKLEGFKPKRHILGYYATKKEALQALSEYNKNPFDMEKSSATFAEMYDMWRKANYHKLAQNTVVSRDAAYKYCEPVAKLPIRDIKLPQLQSIIDDCPHGSNTKKNIKTIMHNAFEKAMEHDLVVKDPTQFIIIEESEPMIERTIFSKDEINKLWSLSNRWDIQVILILLYSGMRVNELLKNTKDNINLEERWIYVPQDLAKNKQSIRHVPIHDKIYPFIENFCIKAKNKIITNDNGYEIAYNNFVSRQLPKINKELGSDHRFHDTRHTFISMCHEYGLDELSVKKIVGHLPQGITQQVYTHITVEQLHKEINKIK